MFDDLNIIIALLLKGMRTIEYGNGDNLMEKIGEWIKCVSILIDFFYFYSEF